MQTEKSPKEVIREQLDRLAISGRYAMFKSVLEPEADMNRFSVSPAAPAKAELPLPKEGEPMPTFENNNETYLHPQESGLSDALILRQIADRKRAERDAVLEDTSLKEMLRAE